MNNVKAVAPLGIACSRSCDICLPYRGIDYKPRFHEGFQGLGRAPFFGCYSAKSHGD